ncbi:MAG: glycosyltransferase family 2 protein [Candidatus Omnitrophica bacterium]|nr:glycosyltransferase family 2 protein [Candidatus Omnitrophota bacterium]
MKVTLLIPTLNEIDGVQAIMPKIKKEWVDQILFLDGNSTDGTLEYIQEHGYEYVLQTEKGLRKGYRECLPHIRGDVLLTFSPDGNSIPELIPECVKKMKEGYDMVIVSRYYKDAKSDDDDWITGFGNWVFTNLLINIPHGHKYADAMVIYRAYKMSMIEELGLTKDKHFEREEKWFNTVVSWEPLLSIRAARQKYKIAEIPGDEPPRIGGKRKLQVWKWGAVFLVQTIREMFVKKEQY